MTTATPAPLVFSPYDYAVHEDPYPFYARLRAEAPVYHNPDLDFWALSKHADVREAFRAPDVFSNSLGVSLDPAAYGRHAYKTMSFLAMDDPRHARLRKLVSKGFTSRRVDALSEGIARISRRYWDECLAKSRDGGEFDFVQDYAGKLPMDVISDLMGVPESDRDELRRLADLVMHREEGGQDVPEDSMVAALDLITYYQGMVAERREERTEDLTSALIDAEIDGEKLDEDEILSFLFLMVVAGNETTTKLLANAMFWGHRNPDQAQLVIDAPERVSDWVEETLRYDTSSQLVLRTTMQDVTVRGVTIPADQKVLLLIGAANRDEEVFDDADTFRLGRDTSASLSFGQGPHFCLGAHLARLEGRIALDQISRSITGYEILPGAERVHSSNVRGFAHLPMRVEVRR
ncbi:MULTISPECIES: cytochrome P450 [unclassified Dietzia]|uniref:cytochrome P450 n=1 Tax=unclassified Dietzia TaxID=2617939 RepID=UPI000D227236|nr:MULTISPECIES: cytochrome P450 [unclassified Dietzia]AVZ40094.1 cytochrome P450 [Dietzia sp. JS16-p6b]MBB1022872.1 cytochrome P450 [Dietzia sp. DQ12-76]MBB1028872.1 cytochrome P450 [Dietzia sp. DQ11-38-2]QGW25519.1 cytochrome P450 monooxygenase [Dietzia sp. DQ12-45-1b]